MTEMYTDQEMQREDEAEDMDILMAPATVPVRETPIVPFESREIEVGKLKIRPQYQRPLQEARVKKMADTFDEALAGTIEVSFAEGHYWVVDGQHRLAAMRTKGIRVCRVLIHYGLTIDEEARLFAKLNSERTAVLPRDLYKAELVAGTDRSIGIRDTVAKHGFRIEMQTGTHGNGIAAVRHLWELHDMRVLNDTLKVIKAGWTDGDGIPVHGATEGRVIAAIGRFIANNQGNDRFKLDRLVTVLMKHRPDELVREARVAGRSWGVGSRNTLFRWYNQGLQNRLPDKAYSPGPK